MEIKWDHQTQMLNRVRENLCKNCNKKYWEACVGIRRDPLDRISGCERVLKMYTKLESTMRRKVNE